MVRSCNSSVLELTIQNPNIKMFGIGMAFGIPSADFEPPLYTNVWDLNVIAPSLYMWEKQVIKNYPIVAKMGAKLDLRWTNLRTYLILVEVCE